MCVGGRPYKSLVLAIGMVGVTMGSCLVIVWLLVLEVIHVDEFIDELLRNERSCDIILPRIQVSKVYK